MVALQVTETVPFGPFGNPYTCQIHAGASPAPLFRQFQKGNSRNSKSNIPHKWLVQPGM
jgi:hypothetical protein